MGTTSSMRALTAARTNAAHCQPWHPRPLQASEWPPDYRAVYAWRTAMLRRLRSTPGALEAARAYYSTRPGNFIMDWMDTYDPRRQRDKWVPFIFFKRQQEVIDFFESCSAAGESGLVEKCRDFGLTWLACAYSVWRWLFIKNDAIGWGSRKETLVDKPGDPDSIFEKIRLILHRLPRLWLPEGFSFGRNCTYMKLLNPATGAIIAGEAGDNIGRGGRRSAQPLDTLVMTPKGLKELGSLKIGDYVIGSDGKPTKIVHIVDWGERQVYKVHFTDGTWTECDAEHLWQVKHKFRRNSSEVLDTQTIMKDYVYKSPKGQEHYRYEIPFIKPVQFDVSHRKLPLDGYIVGALLGDGNVAGVPKYVVKFTSADQEILDEIQRLLPEHCELRKGERYEYRVIDNRSKKRPRSERRSIVRRAVLKAGIAGMRFETKYIPDMYKYSSVETRLSVLQGLMDTDGSASGRTLTFTSTSKKLSMDVRFLVESLGGRATYNIKHDKRGFKDCHCLQISMPENLPPFRLTRKLEIFYKRRKKICRTINKIEPSRKTEVRCIQVENLDGLYALSHCILTHNCYFCDEAAHLERAEKIEAALGDNTNVRIDISSVNGVGNVFHRRRENGIVWTPERKDYPTGYVRVFVADWRDHPAKTQEWYDARKARYEREGLAHIFAQEVDRNYAAAVSNTVITYEWILAAVDAHIKLPWLAEALEDHKDEWTAGLDVADEGNDRNALTLRQYVVWRQVDEWGERDPGISARKAVLACRPHAGNITCQYDCIGVGAGVKTEYNRLATDDGVVDARRIPFIPWNAGAAVERPFERIIPDDRESLQNKDFFDNLKAQAWWSIRTRFYKTYKAVTEGVKYNPDELISIDSSMQLLEQVKKELMQPTVGYSSRLKMLIEKKPNGMRSPNLADSGVMAFFPLSDNTNYSVVGSYGI